MVSFLVFEVVYHVVAQANPETCLPLPSYRKTDVRRTPALFYFQDTEGSWLLFWTTKVMALKDKTVTFSFVLLLYLNDQSTIYKGKSLWKT